MRTTMAIIVRSKEHEIPGSIDADDATPLIIMHEGIIKKEMDRCPSIPNVKRHRFDTFVVQYSNAAGQSYRSFRFPPNLP